MLKCSNVRKINICAEKYAAGARRTLTYGQAWGAFSTSAQRRKNITCQHHNHHHQSILVDIDHQQLLPLRLPLAHIGTACVRSIVGSSIIGVHCQSNELVETAHENIANHAFTVTKAAVRAI